MTMNHDKHDEALAREDCALRRFQMRVASPLSPEAEEAMSAVIGCAIQVHKALGPGFLESIYKKAMHIELTKRGLTFERERAVTVTYGGAEIPGPSLKSRR
jgi:hypothetical protein